MTFYCSNMTAQSKVHKDTDERVWCWETSLACTSLACADPDINPIEHLWDETVSQAFSNISVQHQCLTWDVVKNEHFVLCNNALCVQKTNTFKQCTEHMSLYDANIWAPVKFCSSFFFHRDESFVPEKKHKRHSVLITMLNQYRYLVTSTWS